MIMLTKEQLADLLREAYASGAETGGRRLRDWYQSEAYHDERERAIQPLVHRSSCGQFRERPNHSVHRGHESLPCHCWAESDHPIGAEVRKCDSRQGDKP